MKSLARGDDQLLDQVMVETGTGRVASEFEQARLADYLSKPDEHLKVEVASQYDNTVSSSDHFDRETVEAIVGYLAELAGNGPVVEFAIGTGRIGLPISRRAITVMGMDFSEPMLSVLRRKPGAEAIQLAHGDMTTTHMCSNATLVYLVFNTIGNLRTQAQQVACFRNAANHLLDGGRFVVETFVPQLHKLPPGQSLRTYDMSATHIGIDEYADRTQQILLSHHYFINGDHVRPISGAFRYVWPSELDLMAQLAGMELEHRWADWHKSPFGNESPAHVSVYRKGVTRP